MVAKRSARQERTQAVNQARALIVTGPEELRARFAQRSPAQLIEAIAALRPRPGDVPGYATRVALRMPAAQRFIGCRRLRGNACSSSNSARRRVSYTHSFRAWQQSFVTVSFPGRRSLPLQI